MVHMQTLSPKASRFVAIAMREASEHDRAIWEAVDHDTSKELPAAAMKAALNALSQYEERLRTRLMASDDEDEMADLSNDLGFVCSIERGLRNHVPGRRRAAVPDAAD
jgi:hypothetical protein